MIFDNDYSFEVFAEAVADVLRRGPHNPIQQLEKMGFAYMADDDEDGEEIAEERAARPANPAQQALVVYFESKAPPDESLLYLWQQETLCDEPHYPLWRRYFRQGSAQLKALLLFGLDCAPVDAGLLDALACLHAFSPMLKELIARYLLACDSEKDKAKFITLAQDFDSNTGESGYDALHALASRYPAGSFKARCVSHLLSEKEEYDQPVFF